MRYNTLTTTCVRVWFSLKGFVTSNECEAAEELLEAYESGDVEAMDAIVRRPIFGFLENGVRQYAQQHTRA